VLWSVSSPPDVLSPGARARLRIGTRAALAAAVALTTVALGVDRMGARQPPGLFVLLGCGAVAAAAIPEGRRVIAIATGLMALVLLNPVFSLYFGLLVLGLALARQRHGALFAVILVAGAIVLPKTAFARHYHEPGYWNWLNEPSLALALFAGALWWRARSRQATLPPAPPVEDVGGFLLLFFAPAQAAYPMAFSPRTLAKHAPPASGDAIDLRGLGEQLGWFVAKVAALAALRAHAPFGFLRSLEAGTDITRVARLDLWGMVMGSYVELYLALAASADVPILIARLYGWSLPSPFRAALLAWSPVELWRRWGIYNRQLLLQLVYFPLGAGKRHRTRNVLLTFLASALVLHSGWFGSKYWTVGYGGWRDETIYFLLQGLAVCICLAFTTSDEALAAAPRPVRALWPKRAAGVVATQTWSALVHVVVLAQGIDLATRGRLIARCLGF